MPELPEVEVVVRGLSRYLTGKKIKEVTVRLPKMINYPMADWSELLTGRKIEEVTRIGKMVVIKLDRDYLIFHLKMTGQLVYRQKKDVFLGGHSQGQLGVLPNKWTHLWFDLADGSTLFFNDLRQFGYCHLVARENLDKYANKYGLEPLGKFSLTDFQKLITAHPALALKTFLLNQAYVAGIGNIYADEIAFVTKLSPHRRLSTLKPADIKRLHTAIPEILRRSVANNGTTFSNFLTSDGEPGNFVKQLKVYGRGGEKCLSCGQILKKEKRGGRGTVWCEQCQR